MKKESALAMFDGSPVRLAKALGIRSQAVSQWGEDVPPYRALQLEKILAERAEATQGHGQFISEKAA